MAKSTGGGVTPSTTPRTLIRYIKGDREPLLQLLLVALARKDIETIQPALALLAKPHKYVKVNHLRSTFPWHAYLEKMKSNPDRRSK